MKKCPRCKVEKFEDEFLKTKKPRWKGEEYSSWCKVCNRRRHRRRYEKKRKESVLRVKTWYQELSSERKEKLLAKSRRYRKKRRLEVVENYGGKCKCCGETEIKFLEIDHVNNDGAEHRKKLGSSNIYGWLRLQGYPKGFQVLCCNCNYAKGRYGKCPHKK